MRHSTADQRTRSLSAWLQLASARPRPTRGVPPLPTPVPAGAVRHTGGCLQPVLLRGRADYIDGGTGELIHRYTTVHEPGGVLPIACKTRRASRCPPCAEVYRADTYQLIRAGLTGGKGIPATVADHPCVFVTLTAPSFGPVHARREKDGRVLACRPRRKRQDLPARHRPVLRREARPRRPPARRAAVPGLLRLHRRGPVQRLRPRTVAPVHHHPPPDPGPPGRAHWPGPRRPGPGLLRQGRRIPAPRRRPLPRHHPARRPRRADHGPARLGHPRPAHRRHRPGRPRRQRHARPPRRGSRPARWPGAASSTSGRSPPAAT